MPGRPARRRCDQRARLDQRRAAGVDEQRGRLHAREVGRRDDAARRIDQPHVQRDDVALGEERLLAGGDGEAVLLGARARRLARPHHDRHAERLGVVGDRAGDAPVAVEAERAAAQGVADADLPPAGLERGHLLRDLAHGREDQAPGQLRRRVGRRVRHAGSDETMMPSLVQVSMSMCGIDAALADQPEIGQPLEQRRADLGALADQHQRLGRLQPRGQRIHVLHVIVPDRDLVPVELAEAGRASAACRDSRRGS